MYANMLPCAHEYAYIHGHVHTCKETQISSQTHSHRHVHMWMSSHAWIHHTWTCSLRSAHIQTTHAHMNELTDTFTSANICAHTRAYSQIHTDTLAYADRLTDMGILTLTKDIHS